MSQETIDKSKFSFGSTVQRRKRDRNIALEKDKNAQAETETVEPELSPAQDMDTLAEAADSTHSTLEDEVDADDADAETLDTSERGEEEEDAEKSEEVAAESPMAEEEEGSEEANTNAPLDEGVDTCGEDEVQPRTAVASAKKNKSGANATVARPKEKVTSSIRSINRELNKKTQGKKKSVVASDAMHTRGDEREPGALKDVKKAKLKLKRLTYLEIYNLVPKNVRGSLHLLDLHVA